MEEPLTPGCYVTVSLDGSTFSLPDACRIGRGAAVVLDPVAVARVRDRAELADQISRTRAVYGRTTAVGANRDVTLGGGGVRRSAVESDGRGDDDGDDGEEAVSLRLWRSHAGAVGEPLDAANVRAALGIRVNQLLTGGSGASADLVQALTGLVDGSPEALPVIRRHGDLGTGDLSALAQVGLALAGERPRTDGSLRRTLGPKLSDALPLLSSNAFTLAAAALGWEGLQRLCTAAVPVCALSWLALEGGVEAVGPAVGTVTPFGGAIRVAASTAGLLDGNRLAPRHVQDFFGLRAWPQSHGPLLDALAELRRVTEAQVNAPSENPIYLPARGPQAADAAHHGGFLLTYLPLAIDTTLLALVRSAQSSMSRVKHLLTDPTTGLPRFLASGSAGSSGLLIAEYAAGSALAQVRTQAGAPTSLLTTSVSGEVEDDASFAGLAAARLGPAAAAYRQLLAVELVCAVRALRMRGRTARGRLAAVLEACEALPRELEDRDLGFDFDLAQALVEALGSRPA